MVPNATGGTATSCPSTILIVHPADEMSLQIRPTYITMASLAHMPPASRISTASESSYYPVSRQNTISSRDGNRSLRQSKRYSVTALYLSMSAKEKDMEIEDDLARAQKSLRDLKAKISTQSKRNFVLEKDVRYLDSRIALLIQNRLRIEEVRQAHGMVCSSTDTRV